MMVIQIIYLRLEMSANFDKYDRFSKCTDLIHIVNFCNFMQLQGL